MGNLPISAVDVVVAVVLLGSALFAFMRGFVHEVLAIAAWAGAALGTLYGLPYVRPWFRDHIGMAWAADAAAGLSLFLVILLALSLLTKAASERVRKSALNSVDSSLGFVFGIARGAVLLCLAYMVVAWVFQPEDLPEWLADARSRPWLERGARLLQGLAPEGFGAAETKAGHFSDEARKALEAEKAFRALTSPQLPEGGPAQDRPGYGNASRREMDRLIQSNQ
jgi:membrane protein required for colicin V production